MNAWPLISVVMPAYNAEHTIDQALDSVLWQGYPSIEILVVDDGSSDATLSRLATRGPEVRVFRQDRKGPAAARNLALRHARGEVIAFLDADDIWLPGKLHAQMRYLAAHPDVGIVFATFERWEESGESDGVWSDMPARQAYSTAAEQASADALPATTALCGMLYADLLLESKVHIITAMVRRSTMEALGGFDECWRTGSDYEFWLRASRLHRMAQLSQCAAWYRIHRYSITRVPRPDNAEYALVTQAVAQHGLVGPDGRGVTNAMLQRRLHAIAFGHGYMLFWARRLAWAHRCFAQALRHVVLHPKTWAYLLLTWPATWWSPHRERQP